MLEILGEANHVWYFLLFPLICLFVERDKEAPLLFTAILVSNYYVFDVIGVKDSHWFMVQALYDVLFILGSLALTNKYMRKACVLICFSMLLINLTEHSSEYATVFFDYWEVINWLVMDLIALCILTNDKLGKLKCLQD